MANFPPGQLAPLQAGSYGASFMASDHRLPNTPRLAATHLSDHPAGVATSYPLSAHSALPTSLYVQSLSMYAAALAV